MSLPMEKATYRARAIGAGLGTSEKETSQLAVTFGLVDENDALTDESVTWIGHFTEKTTARTIESLQHMGFQSDDLALFEEPSRDDVMALLPNAVDLVCEPEEYNGEYTLKVRWVNRPGAGRFAFKKPLKGADLKAFAAQMKGQIRNARGGTPVRNGGGAKPQSQQQAPKITDDDLPFASSAFDSEPSAIAWVLR